MVFFLLLSGIGFYLLIKLIFIERLRCVGYCLGSGDRYVGKGGFKFCFRGVDILIG